MAGQIWSPVCFKRPHTPQDEAPGDGDRCLWWVWNAATPAWWLREGSFARADSSLRHTLTACCNVGNGVRANNFSNATRSNAILRRVYPSWDVVQSVKRVRLRVRRVRLHDASKLRTKLTWPVVLYFERWLKLLVSSKFNYTFIVYLFIVIFFTNYNYFFLTGIILLRAAGVELGAAAGAPPLGPTAVAEKFKKRLV